MMNGLKEMIDGICAGASEQLKNDFISSSISNLWDNFMADRNKMFETMVNDANIYIPNASNKKEYVAEVSFAIDGITRYWIEGLEETGLECKVADDLKSFTISGTPAKAGDFELKLRYLFDGCSPEDVPYRKLLLIVNPDPRDLWKELPVPEDIEYPKEDTQKEFVKVPALDDGTPQKDIVAASKRGRSHAQEGKPRDDHFKLFHNEENNWYVIAVADGAGSARFSREGSRIACETAVSHCITHLSDCRKFEENIQQYDMFKDEDEAQARKYVGDDIYRIVATAAYKAQKAIYAEAEKTNMRAKDYATTFLLTISKKFSFGWFIASFWVGDGAICLYDNKGATHTAKLLGVPDEGEYAGQTRFLTMPDIFRDPSAIYQRLRFCIVPDFTALFLMTDGVSDPMFETDANLNNPERWDALWDNLQHDKEHPVDLSDDNEAAAAQLLDWLDFWSPGNHDDRTIAILY